MKEVTKTSKLKGKNGNRHSRNSIIIRIDFKFNLPENGCDVSYFKKRTGHLADKIYKQTHLLVVSVTFLLSSSIIFKEETREIGYPSQEAK